MVRITSSSKSVGRLVPPMGVVVGEKPGRFSAFLSSEMTTNAFANVLMSSLFWMMNDDMTLSLDEAAANRHMSGTRSTRSGAFFSKSLKHSAKATKKVPAFMRRSVHMTDARAHVLMSSRMVPPCSVILLCTSFAAWNSPIPPKRPGYNLLVKS